MKTLSSLRDEVASWNGLKQHIHDLAELVRLGDEALRDDLETELAALEVDLENAPLHPCYLVRTITMMPSLPFMQAQAEPTRRIGQ